MLGGHQSQGFYSQSFYDELAEFSRHPVFDQFKEDPNTLVLLDNVRLGGVELGSLVKLKVTDTSFARALQEDTQGHYIKLKYYHKYTCQGEHEYSPMAMLWLNGAVPAAKVLMQRGYPHLIPPAELIATFLVYFFLATITAGSSVPA